MVAKDDNKANQSDSGLASTRQSSLPTTVTERRTMGQADNTSPITDTTSTTTPANNTRAPDTAPWTQLSPAQRQNCISTMQSAADNVAKARHEIAETNQMKQVNNLCTDAILRILQLPTIMDEPMPDTIERITKAINQKKRRDNRHETTSGA